MSTMSDQHDIIDQFSSHFSGNSSAVIVYYTTFLDIFIKIPNYNVICSHIRHTAGPESLPKLNGD